MLRILPQSSIISIHANIFSMALLPILFLNMTLSMSQRRTIMSTSPRTSNLACTTTSNSWSSPKHHPPTIPKQEQQKFSQSQQRHTTLKYKHKKIYLKSNSRVIQVFPFFNFQVIKSEVQSFQVVINTYSC